MSYSPWRLRNEDEKRNPHMINRSVVGVSGAGLG